MKQIIECGDVVKDWSRTLPEGMEPLTSGIDRIRGGELSQKDAFEINPRCVLDGALGTPPP